MRKLRVHRNTGVAAALLGFMVLGAVSSADETEVTRTGAWLGVSVQRLDQQWRERENYWGKGVIVTDVVSDGPAALAGVGAGDVIVSIGSKTLMRAPDLAEIESELVPGEPISIVVVRNGGRLMKIMNMQPAAPPQAAEPEAKVPDQGAAPEAEALPGAGEQAPEAEVLPGTEELAPEAETPDQTEALAEPQAETDESEAETDESEAEPADESDVIPVPDIAASRGPDPLGARFQTLNSDLAAVLGVTGGQGVLILDVQGGGIAESIGLKAGDVITKIGKYPVTSAEDVQRLLELGPTTSSIRAFRQGAQRTVRFRLVAAKIVPKAPEAEPETIVKAPEPEALVPAPEAAEAEPGTPLEAAQPETAAPAPKAAEAAPTERLLLDLQKEIRQLKEEVRRIRAELDDLKST